MNQTATQQEAPYSNIEEYPTFFQTMKMILNPTLKQQAANSYLQRMTATHRSHILLSDIEVNPRNSAKNTAATSQEMDHKWTYYGLRQRDLLLRSHASTVAYLPETSATEAQLSNSKMFVLRVIGTQ